MSSIRYSSSFVISTIIYVVIIAIYFNIMDRPKPMHKPKEHRIKIAIITPPTPPKIKPKPIVKSTPIPTPIIVTPKPKVKHKKAKHRKIKYKKIKHKKVIKKEIHKKIIKRYKKRKVIKQHKQKPKLKHKIKKVIKHKKITKIPKVITQPIELEETSIPVQEKVITKPQPIELEETPIPIQEEVITKYQPIPKQVTTRTEPIKIASPQQPKENLNTTKREFLQGVRAKIYANKRYPARARRRHIQGRVHVVFDILPDGEVANIRIDNSPRILKKEVRRSMRKSFPIDIPPSLASMFPMRNISVNINFELE